MFLCVHLPTCCLVASCMIVHAGLVIAADDCEDDQSCKNPNRHQRVGMNNHHWPSCRQILQGPKRFATANYEFWYGDKMRADDHGHNWCDYAYSGDCYNDDWRTTTRWDREKTADFHRRTRDHSLAVEAEWCRVWPKCQAGYIADTSGRPLLNIPRAQSECGIPPKDWPMFGGKGVPYRPYVYRSRAGNRVQESVCPPELAASTLKQSLAN